MTKKEFDKMEWTRSVRVNCPDGDNKSILSVDFEDDTVNVLLAPRLNSWFSYKQLDICTEAKPRESKAKKEKTKKEKPKKLMSVSAFKRQLLQKVVS